VAGKWIINTNFKVEPSMAADIERIANELFPEQPGAQSVFLRQVVAKAIAAHDEAQQATGKRKKS
jgi:metal-dependent HD superfamily phosphatase/phosphodiesterase